MTGNYVAGWIKRGPTGIIGTNKPDAIETVDCFLADYADGNVLQPADASEAAIIGLLQARKPTYITFDDWKVLDEIELQRGKAIGRSRVKFTTVEEMLDALGKTPELAGVGK